MDIIVDEALEEPFYLDFSYFENELFIESNNETVVSKSEKGNVDYFVFGLKSQDSYSFNIQQPTSKNLTVSIIDQNGTIVENKTSNSTIDLSFNPAEGQFAFLSVSYVEPVKYAVSAFTSANLSNKGASIDQAQTIALIYEAALNRNGNIDVQGLNFWIDVLENGTSFEQISNSFLESNEFIDSFGSVNNMSDLDLVEILYQNVLNRDGEIAGINFWVNFAADPNFSDAQLLIAFAESPENRNESGFVETLSEPTAGFWDFIG